MRIFIIFFVTACTVWGCSLCGCSEDKPTKSVDKVVEASVDSSEEDDSVPSVDVPHEASDTVSLASEATP